MIPNLTVHEKLLMCSIKRWHMVSTTRDQTLAEHSYGVMLIAMEIAECSNIDPRKVVDLALYHDIDEVRTGDISPPAKLFMREQGYDPDSLVADNGDVKPRWDIVYMVKAADFIESILFISQYGVGKHAEQVTEDLIKSFEQYVDSTIERTDPFLAGAVRAVYHELLRPVYNIWDSGKNYRSNGSMHKLGL